MAWSSIISRGISALYIGKSTLLKTFLLTGVLGTSMVFIWYTFNVIDKLQEDTRSQVEMYVKMWQLAANSPTSGDELQFIFDEVIVKANFPIIVLDSQGRPIHWRNVEGHLPGDTGASTILAIGQIADRMVADHGKFELYFGDDVNYFCYGDPEVVGQLRMMPFVEIGIVLAFMLVGIIGFQNIRKSEERHIWVGMAKETAHQLGTPITSMMGWLDLIDAELSEGIKSPEHDMSLTETIDNMRIDVVRLEQIANRFSKIGSAPELKPWILNDLVVETVEYYRRRLPFQGRGSKISFTPGETGGVAINPELMGWALENMIKNSLQAVDSKSGTIDVRTGNYRERKMAFVEFTDNGTGIAPAAARKIFRAGFTTKKRGWGLGLTLVKRIIEEYHGGKVALKKSRPGETIFELLLPMSPDAELRTDHSSDSDSKG